MSGVKSDLKRKIIDHNLAAEKATNSQIGYATRLGKLCGTELHAREFTHKRLMVQKIDLMKDIQSKMTGEGSSCGSGSA